MRSNNITAEMNNPFFYISNSIHYNKQQNQHQQNPQPPQNHREQMKASTPNYLNRNTLANKQTNSPSQLGINSSAIVKPLSLNQNKDFIANSTYSAAKSETTSKTNTSTGIGNTISQNLNLKSFADQHHHSHSKAHDLNIANNSHSNVSNFNLAQNSTFEMPLSTGPGTSSTSTLPPIVSGKRINLPLGPHRYL